jgi:hypothetical protein
MVRRFVDMGDGTHAPVVSTGAIGLAATIADGADVTQGAIADAAVTTDTTGTLSGKLRGLVKWAYERMPAALGMGTMAQSLPVVLPSDMTDGTYIGDIRFGEALPAGANNIGDIDVLSMPANTIATGTVTTVDVTAAPHTTPTTGSYVEITVPAGAGTVGLHVTGTFTGQLEFEGSMDIVNYPAVSASDGTATVNAIAGVGAAVNAIYILPGGAYRRIRVRASAWAAGTATITFVGSIGTSASIQTGSLPAGTNAIGTLAANSGVDIGDVDVTSTVAPAGKAAAAGNVHEPAANTAAVVTLAAGGAGVSNVLGLVAWSYDSLPVAGSLTVEDGAGTTVFKVDVPESGPGFFPFTPGLSGTAATAMIITLAAGGAGVSGIVSVHAWTE